MKVNEFLIQLSQVMGEFDAIEKEDDVEKAVTQLYEEDRKVVALLGQLQDPNFQAQLSPRKWQQIKFGLGLLGQKAEKVNSAVYQRAQMGGEEEYIFKEKFREVKHSLKESNGVVNTAIKQIAEDPAKVALIFPGKKHSGLNLSVCQAIRHQLKEARSDQERYAIIGAIDPRFLHDSRIVFILRSTHFSWELFEKGTDQEVLGRIRLVHQQLIDQLLGIDPTFPLTEAQVDQLQQLVKVILAVETLGDRDLQMSLSLACRYLANHYRGVQDYAKADYYMSLPSLCPMHVDQRFRDLNHLRKEVGSDVRWISADSSMVRRCQMRIKVDEGEIRMTCTVPENVREEIGQHIQSLQDRPLAFVKVEKVQKSYVQGQAHIDVGDSILLSNLDQRIVIQVGVNPQVWNEYEKLSIEVDSHISGEELYHFIAQIGLSCLLLNPRPEDMVAERLAKLAAAHHPQSPCVSPESWVREALKSSLLQRRVQSMQFSSIDPSESIDPTAPARFRKAGGVGFGATVGFSRTRPLFEALLKGGLYEIKPAETVASTASLIARNGFFSTLERFERGDFGIGCCPDENLRTGSGNQVFTRPISQRQFTDAFPWVDYAIPGSIFMLISSQAAERMPYTYPYDYSGLRNPKYVGASYRIPQKEGLVRGLDGSRIKEQHSLIETVRKQEKEGSLVTAEAMFEQTLAPAYIVGMLVATSEEREKLIEKLHADGIHMIQWRPVESAVIASPTLSPSVLELFEPH